MVERIGSDGAVTDPKRSKDSFMSYICIRPWSAIHHFNVLLPKMLNVWTVRPFVDRSSTSPPILDPANSVRVQNLIDARSCRWI